MPKLRRHRRDHRARAPKSRKRRNLVKFIPEADSDFALTANGFLSYIKHRPDIFNLSEEQVAEIENAVKGFRAALSALLQARYGGAQSPQLRMRKDSAREKAEECVRTFGNIIRSDPRVPEMHKTLLRLKLKPKKLGKRKCPKVPPKLIFAGSGDGVAGEVGVGSGSGVHVIRFFGGPDSDVIKSSDSNVDMRRAKPDGAVRIELYFDMVPVGESVPRLPNERGWPKYLRSYTRSPMEVEFPLPVGEPMLLVYWARWADSTGEVSRWSKPCVARVEGWTSQRALPEGAASDASHVRRVETRYVFIQTPHQLPDHLEGDVVADEIAGLMEGGQRMLEAARQAPRMLDAA